MRPLLMTLEEVWKVYDGSAPVSAVRGVSLDLAQGDYLALMGRSGSGKSTLLNLMGLLDKPSYGRIRLRGRDVVAMHDNERAGVRGTHIGFVFQLFNLLAYRSVRANVALALMYTGVPRGSRADLAEAALARVGMAHKRDAFPATLSGGERQRVAIARALVTKPSLLMCDEPTGSLDRHTANDILRLLGALHEDGLTIVLVTHDSAVADQAERLLVMEDGRMTSSHRVEAL